MKWLAQIRIAMRKILKQWGLSKEGIQEMEEWDTALYQDQVGEASLEKKTLRRKGRDHKH